MPVGSLTLIASLELLPQFDCCTPAARGWLGSSINPMCSHTHSQAYLELLSHTFSCTHACAHTVTMHAYLPIHTAHLQTHPYTLIHFYTHTQTLTRIGTLSLTPTITLPLQLKLSEQDLVYLAASGRLLLARPYGQRLSHQQGLAACIEAAEVRSAAAEGRGSGRVAVERGSKEQWGKTQQ